MDYAKIYEDLILRGLKRSEDWENKKRRDGYERHHIVPRCMGGGDEESNLVLLTIREHFLAHRLLTKIHPGNQKLCRAVFLMSVSCEGVVISSGRGYEKLRDDFLCELRETMSGKATYRNDAGEVRVFPVGGQPEGWFHNSKGTALYINEEGVIKRFSTEEVPEGWSGRNAGKSVYTDGEEFKMYEPGCQPEGWYHASKGTTLYTDGVEVRRFTVGCQPEGYHHISKGKANYTNGLENKSFPIGTQPEGWVTLKPSEYNRMRLSQVNSGNNHPQSNKNLYNFENKFTGESEVGITQHDMGKKYNLNRSHLSRVIRKLASHHKGWKLMG